MTSTSDRAAAESSAARWAAAELSGEGLEDESYNLAARIYGNGLDRASGATQAPTIKHAPPASRDRDYNLAARVHGNPARRQRALGRAELHGSDAAAPAGRERARPRTAVGVAGAPPTRRFSIRTFDAFQVHGFRWFFLAMMGQMTSMNMQMLVRGFLVFELTGSYAALGTISLANALPGISLSLVGGVLADRVSQKKYLVQLGQLINSVNAIVVAALLVMNLLRFEHLFAASVVQGTVMALMMPARQSMIPEIVGLERLMNAVALNSAGMNSMRLIAPAIGGFLLAAFDAYVVYFVMAAMYFWAVAFLVKVPNTSATAVAEAAGRRRRRGGGGMAQMFDGLRYIARDSNLRAILSVNVLLILMSMPYIFLLPGFVAEVLNEGPDRLGLLLSATGAGSLLGALVIASLPPKRRGLLFLLTSLIQGIGLLMFSASIWFWVTMPIMVFMGIGQAGRQSFSNVLVQTYVEDDYRGRVMSIYMLQFSLTSFGTFFVGMLAAVIGAQLALGLTSLAMIVIALGALLFFPRLRNLD